MKMNHNFTKITTTSLSRIAFVFNQPIGQSETYLTLELRIGVQFMTMSLQNQTQTTNNLLPLKHFFH